MRVLCIGLDSRVAQPDRPGHAVEWTRELARCLDEYVVLAESPDGRARGPVVLAPNAVAYQVPAPRALYPLGAARFALRLHRIAPFDVVTTEDPIRAGIGGLLFSRRTGVPLNVENHSLHINEPVWLTSRAHHHLYNRIAIHVVRQAHTVRNYSPDQTAALLALGVPLRRIYVIPAPARALPPVAREAARHRFGLSPEEEVVLSAGRMVPYKNLGTLLEAFARLRGARPARLVLAGQGPCRRRWMRLGARLGLGDAVMWLDAVPEEDMAALYAAADVFVAPALHETGPRSVLEAYLAECPVIATPRMGVVHFGLCADQQTGRVVSPDDPEAMAKALEQLLSDSVGAHRMAREGRARVLATCGMREIARGVAQVYRDTARRAPRSTASIAPLPTGSSSWTSEPVSTGNAQRHEA